MKNVSVHIEGNYPFVFYDSFQHNECEFVVLYNLHEGFVVYPSNKNDWFDLDKVIYHKSDKFPIGAVVKSDYYQIASDVVLASFKEIGGMDGVILFRNGWYRIYDASDFELVGNLAEDDDDLISYDALMHEYQRMLKLAEDVNGEGNICCRIVKAKGEWAYEACLGIEGIDILFTLEGAKKACEILNSGNSPL